MRSKLALSYEVLCLLRGFYICYEIKITYLIRCNFAYYETKIIKYYGEFYSKFDLICEAKLALSYGVLCLLREF